MLVLTVIQGPDKGKKFELPPNEPQLVGRSSEALPLIDTTVSRRHAELTPDSGEWFIRDLQSQNGTWVNGVRIRERTRLKPGDQVRTGSTLFVFGRAGPGDEEPIDVIRILRPDAMESNVERVMASNEDSVILAEPEPRSAAVHHLRVIYQLTTLTSQSLDRDSLLTGVMELVFNEFRPERGFIVLEDGISAPNGPRPSVVKYATRPAHKDDAKIEVSRTILQHALRRNEGVLSSNAMQDRRFAAGDSVQRFAIRSAICSPIRFRERNFGVIYIDSSIANYTFTPEQLALMNAIGQHAGLALANLELFSHNLQAERLAAMGETVASLSHSIKNILQGMRGGADVVELGFKKDDLKVAKGGWGILKRNLERIMGLTLNMLTYSRQRRPEFELTKVAALLDECAQLLTDQCVAKGVALIVDADPEIPPIALDPHLIHQALINLMGNAVEAVETKRGAVTVRATYHHAGSAGPRPGEGAGAAGGGAGRPEVHISVIDNGPGIPAENHRKIFEPFFTTKGLRGTGLGLAVTKRIIDEHHGRIRVESSEGRGATFTVILPADAAISMDPSATAAAARRDPHDPA
ncbi:MAG: FHA domain-containing protein [Phycisphaeraceae bacterium]|nr:FHA domain-containing protein [Phycisphaeraceae bacterium]